MTRRSALSVLLLLAPAFPDRGLAQDTLVAIRGLTVHSLRTQYFALDTDQPVLVTGLGAEPQGRSALRRFLDHGVFQSKENKTWDQGAWPGNAWIINARTRQVVWELKTAQARSEGGGLRAFEGMVRLPAGVYEAHYAALFPVSRFRTDENDWRVRPARNEQGPVDQLRGPYLDDERYRQFQLTVRGAGRRVKAETAERERNRSTLVSLRGRNPESRERMGFELDRGMDLDVYVIGEREGGWNDFGWIVEATTRRPVWTARNGTGEYAGGARKNRVVRATLNLPAGRYLAGYRTDDSHHQSAWNETPPHDPFSWGLTIRVPNQNDQTAARAFEYDPAPAAAFVTLTGLGDDELKWQRFALSRPNDLKIFALGEASGREFVDYGWIVDADGKVVWTMHQDLTELAGGAEKNRVFAGTLRLDAGSYTAYYRTDGSHSYGGHWNADEPMDGEYWGITIGPAAGKRDVSGVRRLAEDAASDASVLARLTRVRGDRTEETSFRLAARSPIRVYAIGEGGGEMFDFATISDSAGREVWRMAYGETEPAGGASKNRRVDRTMLLEAGTYAVRFKTDASHGWADWNAAPPDDPLSYGVTVFRATATRP